jgi:PAS domain S-box-containing protein
MKREDKKEHAMKKSKGKPADTAELRRRAEKRLSEKQKSQRPEAGDQSTAEDVSRLVHELQVHQIELEMQNQELQQSRAKVETLLARYTDLYDSAPAGYMTLDREGAFRLANLTGARLLGVERSQLVNRRLGLFIAESDRRAFSDFLQRVFASQAKECCEVTLPQEGSQPRVVRIEGTRSADGQECHAVVLEITDRKRAEEALRQSEEMFRSLSRSSPLGVFMADSAGHCVYVNPRHRQIMGVGLVESQGEGWMQNIHPDDRQWMLEEWNSFVRGERDFSPECRVQIPQGGDRWIRLRASRVLSEEDKVTGHVGTSEDITEGKRAEEALGTSELRYRRLFESAKDGILILNAETGMVVDVNPFLVELLGYSREAFLGKKVWELGLLKDTTANQAHFAELQQKEYIRYEDIALETSDGRRIEVEFVSSVYQVSHQKVIQCDIRDITERQKAREKMRRMQTELEQSNRDLQRRNQEIQTFYHTLSHELKTPLTSAREFVSIVIDGLAGPLNETQLEYLGIAKESCDQLRLYVNDLLDVTRLETGKLSLDIQAVPLAALIERVVEMLAPAAAGKGVSLSCDSQPDLPAVPIDKQRILQVLTNLTTNAIKFTPAGGQIRLSLSQGTADPECLQVAVRDTGRGIPKDQLDLIFNRLYQVNEGDRAAESWSGLGLGLYICQELVQLHGGRISVESELGQGSTFTFTIPKRHEPATLNVLVVDDEATVRNMLRVLLENKGYHVTLAGGGAEALGLMRQQRPALVILDLEMPGMDGAETLVQIREEWGEIPVVVHTSYPEGDLMNRALKGTPFTVLAKPCPMEQMLNTAHTLTRGITRPLGNANPTRLPSP